MRLWIGARVAAVLLVAFMLMVAGPVAANGVAFDDLPTWNWSWEYVQGVVAAGIAQGYDDGYYRPGTVVTRDQMAVYVARALCGGDEYVPTGPATASFEDVPNTGYGDAGTDPHWALKYVEYAVEAGVVAGYDDGYYRPDADVTRGQMAAFMARAMCGGEEYVPLATGDPSFPDVGLDSWCYDYVEYIAGEGVTQGYPDGLYYPDVPCSRDQMAVYICRAFDLPLPPSPYDITEHFPLGGEDTWVYETPEGVYTKTISGVLDLFGFTYAGLVNQDRGDIEYWRVAPEGLYLGGRYEPEEGTVSFDPALYIANGLFASDSDNQTSTAYLDGETELGPVQFGWQFVGVETVTVPAGTFEDCMKLQVTMYMGGEPDQFHIWAAKGVGIVKLDSGSFGGDWWEVLLSAEVGRASYPTNVGPFTMADYYPLDVGNTWVYESTDGDNVVQVVGLDDVGGIDAARMVEGPAMDTPDARYFAVIDGALCFVGEYDGDSGQVTTLSPPIAFPTAASIGDSGVETAEASVDGTPAGTVTLEWAVVGAGSATTTAGTFTDCVKLRIAITDPSDEKTESYSWMALGVGPVKEDERPFGGTWWTELKEADIGSVHYPTAGQTFDIQEYADFTVGNTWDYGAATWTVTGTIDDGGKTWAAWESSTGEVRYWRTDETGAYFLGYDYGGTEERYDPPFHIPGGLAPGDSGTQTSDILIDGTPVGTTYFAYSFDGIEAFATEAGLFGDCMAVGWGESSSPDPSASTTLLWARSVGIVGSQVSTSTVEMVSAEIDGRQYPPDEMVFDVTDYFPLEIGNAWSTIWQGEGWYGAERVLVPSTEDLSGLGVTDTVYRVIRYMADTADGADFWASLPTGLARYGHWDPGTTIAVYPPLVTPNGISIGDSDSGTSAAYIWEVDLWAYAGSISATWELVAAGPVATSAGYFPDCILLRYDITPPGEDTMIHYVWLAKGIGPVMESEAGEGEWSEITGATIGGVTTPADPAPATKETATITAGASLGFDFSAGAMAALPDDQDLTYIYTSVTEAVMESFASDGISRYIGYGDWDFLSLYTYSTFLPPDWDLHGWTWWQSASVLDATWDNIDDSVVVKTRDGNYALVHVVAATGIGLDIEYVYPYGWFGWD